MSLFAKSRNAIATVCTPGFFTGTMVMLHSFFRNNPTFDGDVLIIHEGLSGPQMRALERFNRLKWIPVGEEILRQVDALLPDYPDFERRKGQFYSLEVIRQDAYTNILFLDSDILVLGKVADLFDRPEPLLVCGTVKRYRPDPEDGGNPFTVEAFNAGFMRFQQRLLGNAVFQELVEQISLSFFSRFIEYAERHDLPRVGTDQLILNHHFRDVATFLPGSYNYRSGIATEIFHTDGIWEENALVLHFTGRKKPWHLDQALLKQGMKVSGDRMFHLWHQEYLLLLDSMNTIKE